MTVIAPTHGAWLTSRRLRAQGLSLALGLWIIYAWVLATPGLRDRNGLIKGTDFLHFYTLGALARAHRGADLYNMQTQTELLGERVPAAAGTVYLPLYGPQVSLLFAPFAALWCNCFLDRGRVSCLLQSDCLGANVGTRACLLHGHVFASSSRPALR